MVEPTVPRCGAVFPTGLRKVATGLRKVALRCEMADRGTALRTRSKSLGGANCGRRRCRTRGWGRRRGLPWRGVASGITNARACILKHRAPERGTEAGPSLWGLYHAVCTESGRRGCQGRHHAWPPWTPWMPRAAPRLPPPNCFRTPATTAWWWSTRPANSEASGLCARDQKYFNMPLTL